MSDTTEFPRSWKFFSDDGTADGPVFLGRFEGTIGQGETAYGPKPVARFIEEESGEEVSLWLFQQTLLDRMSKLAPEKGELVRVEYHGKKKSKTSTRSYQSFSVTAPERPVEALSWGSLAVHDEEEDDE